MSRWVSSRPRAVLICLALVALGGGVVDIIQSSIIRSLSGILGSTGSLSPLGLLANFAIGYGLPLAIALGFVFATRHGVSYFDLQWPTRWGYIYALLGVFIRFTVEIGLSIGNSIFGLTPAENSSVEMILAAGTTTTLIGIALLLVVAVPVEELFYRNTIQKRLGEAFSGPAAVMLASIFFALSHIAVYYDPAITPMISPLIGNLAAGVIYGTIYHRTGNIVPAILAHGLYNTIGVVVALT